MQRFILIFIVFFFVFTGFALSDTGQVRIYRKPKPQGESPHSGTPLPHPIDEGDLMSYSPEGRSFSFNEPFQRAVIAWNGKEEILVLSTIQKPLEEKGRAEQKEQAVVSILPLSGKPIQIDKGDPDTFKNWQEKIYLLAKTQKPEWWKEKTASEDGGRNANFDIHIEKKIGAHDITALEVKTTNVAEFYSELQEYLDEKYGGGVSAWLGPEEKAVFEDYITNRKFKYFAVDIQDVPVNRDKREKDAIVYRFETPYLFYPLVVSKLGGKGDTQVQVIAVTPYRLPEFKEIKPEMHTPTVLMRPDDFRELNQKSANFTEFMRVAGDKYTARIWLINGKLDKFDKDLIAE